jgi:hypothetical protein
MFFGLQDPFATDLRNWLSSVHIWRIGNQGVSIASLNLSSFVAKDHFGLMFPFLRKPFGIVDRGGLPALDFGRIGI